MANVTDPLACPIHGTNPQNLIEYITRQRIYDSQYWKEQCFGLTAADVAEKSAMHLHAIGGSYGGNSKPTRFLSLILKMLQIQPEESIIDELISNEEFKYVRALGMFYLRLTGRPADIYEKLEPMYNDYRKLKFRNPTDWKLMYVDEFVDELLREERVCGIALPRLPKREMLEEAGYLDGPRKSAVQGVIGVPEWDDEQDMEERLELSIAGVKKIESLLEEMAADGNSAAIEAIAVRRGESQPKGKEKNESDNNHSNNNNNQSDGSGSDHVDVDMDIDNGDNVQQKQEAIDETPAEEEEPATAPRNSKSSKRKREKKSKGTKTKTKTKKGKFGSLFKSASATNSSSTSKSRSKSKNDNDAPASAPAADENSEEYWNDQRAKLGLAPLKK
mmetsp:Transcript_19766/g.24926  ORF Transcript_19766/g.24926 Transcript_19766/m.24926 type:complete len:389 (+) Transcript_19766:130-1296(+)